MKFKEVMINILIGKEEEDLLGKMDKKELKILLKRIERMKPVLDALGKKETTDQDIWNFKNLIEQNLIEKLIERLKDIKQEYISGSKPIFWYQLNKIIDDLKKRL